MKKSIQYEQCQFYTTIEGLSCPLCGVDVKPFVPHACTKPVADKPARLIKPRKREVKRG